MASTEYNAAGQVIKQNAPYFHPAALGGYRTPDWTLPSQPSLPKTITQYDAYGRAKQVTNPDNSKTCTYYQGLQTAVVYEQTAGGVYKYFQKITATDQLGRLSSVKDYMGTVGANPGTAACPGPAWTANPNGTTSYQYDVADRLTMTTAPDNTQIKITYDALGRKTKMEDPDMGTWLYRYDAVGNLRKQRDARNIMTCFHYDGVNRLVGKSFHANFPDPDTPAGFCANVTTYNVTYSYDAGSNGIGRRTGMTDGSGSASWTYDSRGRVTNESKVVSGTGGGTFVTQWTSYDAMDRVRTMMYPDNEGVTFTYTGQGPLKTVYGSSTYYVGDTVYNALGQVSDRYLGSTTGNIRQKYTYTQAENFRLTALQSGVSPNFNNLQNITYTYDDQGNVLTVVDAAAFGGSQTQTFTYDALNRLTQGYTSGSTSGSYDEDYTYDPAGNITTKGKPKSIWWTYTYGQQAVDCPQGALSKPHAVVSAVAMPYFNHYCYDQNGNMVRRRLGTADVLPRTADAPVSTIDQAIPETQVIDTYLLAYDEENRLKEVSLNGAVVATYTYDGDGKRVKAVVEGVATVYIGNHYERDNSSTVRKYYYAGEVRIAMRTGGNTYYLLNDHLNSTAITTNSNGALVASLLYKPWGETRYDFGVTPTTWRFTGQREDATIGLYYFNARHYDPLLGRFVQADSVIPNVGSSQSLNRYAYVNGNPLKYTDPSGHWLESAIDIGFIVYDIHDIATNGLSWASGGALVADVAGLILPVVTGAGLLVRAASHVDDVAKLASHSDEIVKAATHADEAAAVVRQAENAAELANRAGDTSEVQRATRNWTRRRKLNDSGRPGGT